jgi:hypothetical protein
MTTRSQPNVFIPFITIHFENEVIFHSRKYPVTRINLNPAIVHEPINEQLGIVYQLFKEHQIKYDVSSIGFTYNYSSSEYYQLMV